MTPHRVPIADGHTHSNPVRGLGAEKIAERFASSGGWFMALVALSPWAYKIQFSGFDSYREMIDLHIRECMYAADKGLKVACLAGFHPADIDKLIDKFKLKPLETLDLGRRVLDYEIKLCKEGVLDGIGEIGRQHYKTFPVRSIIAQYLLEYAFTQARDYGCVFHLHLEQEGETTIELTRMAIERSGLSEKYLRRIVFHHSKPSTAVEAYRRGFNATVPGTQQLLLHVLGRVEPVFILESDHIDDPARPGAVVYPWVMAETELRLLEHGRVSEEYLYKINVDNVVKLYNVAPP